MIFLQKFLTNWRAQRGKFLTISLIFHDFSQETLCVDKIISQPRGILCVDKIGSPDRGILCVDKIGSSENPHHPVGAKVGANPYWKIVICVKIAPTCSFTIWKSTTTRYSKKEYAPGRHTWPFPIWKSINDRFSNRKRKPATPWWGKSWGKSQGKSRG